MEISKQPRNEERKARKGNVKKREVKEGRKQACGPDIFATFLLSQVSVHKLDWSEGGQKESLLLVKPRSPSIKEAECHSELPLGCGIALKSNKKVSSSVSSINASKHCHPAVCLWTNVILTHENPLLQILDHSP